MAIRRDRYLIHDETLDDSRAALAEDQKTGDLWMVSGDQFLLGWVLVLRGELDEAEKLLRSALALSDRLEYPLVRGWTLNWFTVLVRKRGQIEAVERYAPRALEVTTEVGLPEQIGLAQANLCWLAWRDGDLVRAQELGLAALDSWAQGQWVYAFQWAARLPLLAMALERERIPEALDQARVMLDQQQMQLPEPLEAALQAAAQAGENDQLEEARKHLERAVTVAQEAGFL
jgi:tetratricopeptide (TPR) repeat protein